MCPDSPDFFKVSVGCDERRRNYRSRPDEWRRSCPMHALPIKREGRASILLSITYCIYYQRGPSLCLCASSSFLPLALLLPRAFRFRHTLFPSSPQQNRQSRQKKTVHGSGRNETEYFRISVDTRWMRRSVYERAAETRRRREARRGLRGGSGEGKSAGE